MKAYIIIKTINIHTYPSKSNSTNLGISLSLDHAVEVVEHLIEDQAASFYTLPPNYFSVYARCSGDRQKSHVLYYVQEWEVLEPAVQTAMQSNPFWDMT